MFTKEYPEEELNQIGVYRITTPSNKIYIGMTCESFRVRWSNHHKDLKNNKHGTPALQNSYNHYKNWELYKLEILTSWNKPLDKNDLKILQKEIFLEEKLTWIKHKNSSYKMLHGCPSGSGSVIHTEESKEKTSINVKKAHENRILCKIFYVNCYICNKLVCSGSAVTKYCLECSFIDKRYFSSNNTCKVYYKNCLKCNSLFSCGRKAICYCLNCDENFKVKNELNYRIPKTEYPNIIDSYLMGKSTLDLGRIYGIHSNMVNNILEEYNIRRRTNSKSLKNYCENNPKTVGTTFEKIQCEICFKNFSINAIERHKESCLNNSFCDKCGELIYEKSSKYCHFHYYEAMDNKKLINNRTEEGIKNGGLKATHNRHHLKRNILLEGCSLCLEYCESNNIPLNITKEILEDSDLKELSLTLKVSESYLKDLKKKLHKT